MTHVSDPISSEMNLLILTWWHLSANTSLKQSQPNTMSLVNNPRHNYTQLHLSMHGYRHNQNLCHLSMDSETTRLYVTCRLMSPVKELRHSQTLSPVNGLRNNQTLCHLSIDSDTTRLYVTCKWTQTQPDSMSHVNRLRHNQTLCHLSKHSDTTRLYVTCQ